MLKCLLKKGRMISNLVRGILDGFGYVLWKREFLIYGIDPFLDIERLSRAWGIEIKIVFDVGANEGQTAIPARKAFPNARIYCFEPHLPTFGRLQANLCDHEILTFPVALSDREGELPFFVYATPGGGTHVNSIVPDAPFPVHYAFKSQRQIVHSRTLDCFCRDYSVEHIDVLKLDTEGSELMALHGAEQMLRAGRIVFVYVEYLSLFQESGVTGGGLAPIAEYLERFGYTYLTSYTDYISEQELLMVANALFARKPVTEVQSEH
jgi:FkbM family methyltransferase